MEVERWIKQKLASAVASGIGEWADPIESAFGKPIYSVADGPMTLTLSELGFTYTGTTPPIERRYDEVEAIELTPLTELVKLRGDLDGILTIGVVLRGASHHLEMQLPLRVYSSVVMVLERIMRELA